MKTLEQIEAMAKDAIPTSDDDWGSERQIGAENAFFDACGKLGLPVQDLYGSAKMSTEDMVSDALARLRMTTHSPL